MVCDASAHAYLFQHDGNSNIISHSFCKQLIFFFREYLLYKVFYFDTLIENIVGLEKCYYNSIGHNYKPHKLERKYKAVISTLEKCINSGIECDFVCWDFKFGTSSPLFIGDIKELKMIIKRIKLLMKIFEGKQGLKEND